ncbi:MAG: carbohydrate transporter ATP-binding protein family [Thermoleophilia bacterium]|nr:carbohydrate transporter ATP-binding protein family [Thermoleophilia bacterium]
MAEIKLTSVDKVYQGGTQAVFGVDLHIADGEFMIMVGPSGCAKSTILRMIAGLEEVTRGTVEIGGRVVNDVAPKDRDIAMVFQSYALYPHMTVRENMAFGLRLRKMADSEIDTRVAEAARILGLEHLLDRLPKAMSGGQRQRVAMGRAIVRDPQVFLMDEPLSNLDAKLRVQMRTEIAKLHQRLGVTTVYVTHDQVEAMTLGQRICILRKGVVQQVNTPFEVYQNPANIFVGGFMGSPGMNFMSGQLVSHDRTTYLRLGSEHMVVPESVVRRLEGGADAQGDVVVGIRPEHLAICADGDPNGLQVQVEIVEAMGAELYAYFTADVGVPDLSDLSDTQATADTFVGRLPSSALVRGGDRVSLRLDLEEVHLFDPQTMRTMLAPVSESEVRARQSGSLGGAFVTAAATSTAHTPAAHAPTTPNLLSFAPSSTRVDTPLVDSTPASAAPTTGDVSAQHATGAVNGATVAYTARGFAPRPIGRVDAVVAHAREQQAAEADRHAAEVRETSSPTVPSTPEHLDEALAKIEQRSAANEANTSPFRSTLAQLRSPDQSARAMPNDGQARHRPSPSGPGKISFPSSSIRDPEAS